MKKITSYLLVFFLFYFGLTFPVLAADQSISFNNFPGSDEVTSFLENILVRIQSVVAFLAVLFIVISGLLYLLAGTSGNEKLAQTAKSCWTAALIGLSLVIAAPAFLKKIKEIFLKDGKVPVNLDSALSIQEIVTNLLNFLLSIFGTLAIISLTVAGIMHILSFGDQKKVSETVKYSLWGILIAGSSLIVVNQIITFITK